jgi:hypothetical protein
MIKPTHIMNAVRGEKIERELVREIEKETEKRKKYENLKEEKNGYCILKT